MNTEQINEINQHISDALEQWTDIMLIAESDGWAYELNYTNRDVFNALYMLNHVVSNVAIKSGYINSEEKAVDAGERFKKAIIDIFGIDTNTLLNKE